MQNIVLSDTSCIIVLENIGQLRLLPELFGQIYITSEIAIEYGKKLPEWISIKEVLNKQYQNTLENSLDRGEASAIALALEQKNCTLLIDEQEGRKVAKSLGIQITGTLGVILLAKQCLFLINVANNNTYMIVN